MQNAAFSLIVAAGILAAAPSSAAEPNDAALARAARDFRIQVYETHREARREYDRWRTAGDELLATWKDSDRTPEQQQQAIDWFSQATPGIEIGELPALPEFPKSTRRRAPSLLGSTLQSSPGAAAGNNFKTQLSIPAATGDVEVPVLNRRRVQPIGQPAQSQPADSATGGFSEDWLDSPNPFEDPAPGDIQFESDSSGASSSLLDSLRKAVLGNGAESPAAKPADAAPITPGDGQ